MKRIKCVAMSFLTGVILLLPVTGFANNDVCSKGMGIPPFLSSGAKPNLLMVLDNSGSMLDSAYSEDGAFCFDDEYNKDGSTTYGGYFQNEKWYKWIGSPYPPWQNRTAYTAGNRIYVNGIIWEAVNPGTSTGTSIADDIGVLWKKIYSIPKWKNNTAYSTNDIVWSGPQLYKAKNSGTSVDADSSNGLNLADATGVTWEVVDSTWLNGKSYAAKSIVSYKGILYETVSGGTSNGTGVYDDQGVTWTRLDEGYFAETTQSEAASHCAAAAGASADKHTHADLCVSLNRGVNPNQVSAFAAKGNLLNWAMSSKFDVEKKILTGGKHNYYDQFLISEHRGCSGSRTIKQIPLIDGKFLSLGMRGSKHSDAPAYEDRLDSTDDTGRLEVLAVTATGYQMSQACKDAIDKIVNHGLNGSQNDIEACIKSFPNATSKMVDMRPTLNHSLQACWQDDPTTETFELNQGHWQSLIDDCYSLYTGTKIGSFTPSRAYKPSELRPADGGPYLCYGLYDSGIDDENRVGYMGRCWIPGGGGIVMKYCNPRKANGECSGGFPCYWTTDNKGNPVNQGTSAIDSVDYRNTEDGLVYKCTAKAKTGNGNAPYICTNWGQQMGTWSDGSGPCNYPSAPVSIGGSTTGVWEVSTWPNNMNVPAWPDNGILKAIADYCDTLNVPEVIDPSSSAGVSGDTGNAPGLLRDSELMAFLGGKDPMSTMKGRILQAKRPEGVIQKVKQDIRLGVMSFNYVGAKAECDQTANTPSKLEKYCPLNNRDGAQLLTYNSQPLTLEVGDFVKANDSTYESGKRYHADELAEAINTVRATSWTPLAEALYSALGYYTQNDKFCLTKDNAGNCLDFQITPDPVQYWCQDNHIVLITEGESTADVNATVEAFADNPSTHYLSLKDGDDVSGGGDNNPQQCGGGLYGSGYLDDMTWWGQHVKPLYKNRYVTDPDGNEVEKQAIYTHVVTTGSLTDDKTTNECNPATLMTNTAVNGGTNAYYPGENPQKLEDNLYAVLDDILSRSSAGSAASVISSSRSGSGASYQAVFWPRIEDKDPDANGSNNKVTWVGDVHSLFVSSGGLMYEDTDQDGKLDTAADKRVLFYFSATANKTRGCYDADAMVANNGQCPEPSAIGDDIVPSCTAKDKCVEIEDIKYLWSANKQLREKAIDIIKDRKIFTWNDADNDGVVDHATEWFKLNTNVDWAALNTIAANSGTRGPVTTDFLQPDDWKTFVSDDANAPKTTIEMEQDALNALIGWLQGVDQLKDETSDDNSNGRLDKALRSRQFTFKAGENGWETKTWRIGDIIHSTPMVVARPAEGYHSIYRDPTYAKFAAKWVNRRNMIYFGGNDGMLHAMNGGFYFENGKQFCCSLKDVVVNGVTQTVCNESPLNGICKGGYDLGEEIWAYVPYNLQPHLKCLASKLYTNNNHKYFVDQKPRIFDAQIFPEDIDHPGGWGTILVGSMRFGGAPIDANELNSFVSSTGEKDLRQFTSSFFILDITNPEEDPVLLGEITRTTENDGAKDKYVDLNYTTSAPAMVIMRDGEEDLNSAWYLIIGNGPTELNGTSSSGNQGKLAVLPLAWLTGEVMKWQQGVPSIVSDIKTAMRIPNQPPSQLSKQGGVFNVPEVSDATFISDIISVDYNIDLTSNDNLGARYRTDGVYFGTVDGSDFKEYPNQYLPGVLGQFYWNGGGRFFRLVTKVLQQDGKEKASKPSAWSDEWTDNNPLRLLADVKMPVVAGPSIGYDGENYWIYGGTGRFYSEKDKTDNGWCLNTGDTACVQRSNNAFFGFKEPIKDANSLFDNWKNIPIGDILCSNKVMTWGKINWDIHKNDNDQLSHNGVPGGRGLMQTDNILVGADTGYLYCYHCATDVTDPSKYVCSPEIGCFPSDLPKKQVTVTDPGTGEQKTIEVYTFDLLRDYIAGTGCVDINNSGKPVGTGLDGWYHQFHDPRERNIGTSTLLGGLLTFTSYQPFNDMCKAEGQSYLYGLHFQTGTAWIEDVFGTFDKNNTIFVQNKLSLGRGLALTPSLYIPTDKEAGGGAIEAFIQTSTGEIIPVSQKKLPMMEYLKSNRQGWTDRCAPEN